MKKPAHWPRPADPEAAARLQECFSVIGKAEARFAKSTAGRAILDAFGGNAPYLADLAIKEPATLRDAVDHGPSGRALGHDPRPRRLGGLMPGLLVSPLCLCPTARLQSA